MSLTLYHIKQKSLEIIISFIYIYIYNRHGTYSNTPPIHTHNDTSTLYWSWRTTTDVAKHNRLEKCDDEPVEIVYHEIRSFCFTQI